MGGSKQLLNGNILSYAVGINNFVRWGDAAEISGNLYTVASMSSAFLVEDQIVPVSLSLGAGSNQKASRSFGVFTGIATRGPYEMDWSMAFNADRWTIGTTVYSSLLEKLNPLDTVVQLGIDDVFDQVSERRFLINVTVPFQY